MKKMAGFEDAIDLAPINQYLEQHGRVRAIVYDPRRDAVLFCLQYYIIPYMRATKTFGAPLSLPEEFLCATTIKDEVLIMTTHGIFTLADDPKES